MSSNDLVVVTEDLTKTFGEFTAVNGFNLEV
jgi:ABC-type branched-subunit amino acid transport system ATPase component